MNANFSDHSAIKIKISKSIQIGKSKINWKLYNMILQYQLIKEQIIETRNNFIEENDNDEILPEPLAYSQSKTQGKI